ncbi:unnamed protein product [Bursaphelenchus xylophilus]|uniref:Ubiquitin-protein ligase E3B n=1 Tax=Bursaphelenchus xylophilus TaxID=6326 RepID=A0A811KKV8_BURXY|nr:unnamed protein product [Bursaphelenchus xylophilus]CAG9099413.1 unnamed protein product [Bursaphelenchus xylophilus]
MAFINLDQQRFLERSQQERKEREQERVRQVLFSAIGAVARGYLVRKDLRRKVLNEFHEAFGNDGMKVNGNTKLLKYGKLFFSGLFKNSLNNDVVCHYFKVLVKSITSNNKSYSFATLFLSVQYIQPASQFIQNAFSFVSTFLSRLNVEHIVQLKMAISLIEFLDVYSDPSQWGVVKEPAIRKVMESLCLKMIHGLMDKVEFINLSTVISNGLKGTKTALPHNSLNHLALFVFRILKSNAWSEEGIDMLLDRIFVCPAFYSALTPDTLQNFEPELVFKRILSRSTNGKLALDNVVVSVNFLGNFVELTITTKGLFDRNVEAWTSAVNYILEHCQERVFNKKYFHSVLGWTGQRLDEGSQAASNRVQYQVELLWSKNMVDQLFGVILKSNAMDEKKTTKTQQKESSGFDFVQKVIKIAEVCKLYQILITTFRAKKPDVLSGLCRNEKILASLWEFINEGGVESYWKLLTLDPNVSLPYSSPLELFAEAAHSLISILDEKELYENQKPFTLKHLCEISSFLNTFCFRCIWEEMLHYDDQHPADILFQSVYQLNSLLLMRDSRKSFAPTNDFWIVKDVKATQIVAEFEKGTTRSQRLMQMLPHSVSIKQRILLFRKLIQKDKSSVRHEAKIIEVHRDRLLEDGFVQLSDLSSRELKGIIRVKFVNYQGLPEVGIDQDGVFKEFLELTLKKVFDPGLNLFKNTANNVLYPSSTSYIHENHLNLFEFVGKMLGKAVYEGICIDLHLAPVLLAAVLKKKLWAFDELSSLDPELYKNLTFVKHYDGDVEDLGLTFAFSEEVLGKVETHELIAGGGNITVNNINKISYIHRMALYRVVHQTQEQCQKFVEGFRAIIAPQLLSLFTPVELQYLVSGQNDDIDLDDLKRHTQYFGGFHSNHRVIRWLWEVLEKDFTPEERHLFLKFGTSCSRPPLLGFAYLEPPFSIRCVETSDDNDQGDTLGSVIRGFLAIKRKNPNRLPTASTCFNLLKLPNYAKKSILLEKLRYAIHAETGFELS